MSLTSLLGVTEGVPAVHMGLTVQPRDRIPTHHRHVSAHYNYKPLYSQPCAVMVNRLCGRDRQSNGL